MFGFFLFLMVTSMALSIVVKHPLLVILVAWMAIRWNRSQRDARDTGRPERMRRTHTTGRSTPSRRAHAAAVEAVKASDMINADERRELLGQLDEGLAQVDRLRAATRRLADSEDPRLAGVAEQARERRVRFEADCNRVVSALAALHVQGTGAEALEALTRATDDLANRVAARAEINALAI